MRGKNQDLVNCKLFPGIVSYTIPIILTGVLQLLYNAADLIVVGQFSGSECVGAVGATGSLFNLLTGFFTGLSIGAGATTAYYIGAERPDDVHKTVHTAIPFSMVLGAGLSLVGVIFARTFLEWMGTPADFLPLSTTYMRIYFSGMVFMILYNFGAAILRANGDTRHPLYYLIISGGVNVVLNLLFVVVFDMNVAGVALATVLSQALSAGLVMLSLLRCIGPCHLSLSKMRFYRHHLKRIIRIGIPTGVQSLLFNISNVMIQTSVNDLASVYGNEVVTGNSAAGSIAGFTYTSMYSFMQTSMNFVSQNYGAKKTDRIKKTLMLCSLCVTVVGLTVGAISYIFGPFFLGFYLPEVSDLGAVKYGMQRLAMTVIPYFLCGNMDVLAGSMRGIGYSQIPMIVCILGVCGFRLVWILWVFPLFPSLDVLYLCWPISWGITALVEAIVFVFLFRKVKRKFELTKQEA